MVTIYVNNRALEAEQDELLLQALERADIHVPTLCYMENLSPTGACRMCVVELEGRPNLVPACATPVYDGMRIQTHSPRVIRARRTIIELLLANHPDDCLYCARSGSCQLQNLSRELDVYQRRYKGKKPAYKVDISSPSLERDPAKCILCGRCVRTCEDIQTVSAIDFTGRGSNAMVDTPFGEGINISSCIYCGQCIVACPTGALREVSHIKYVLDALNNPEMTVVAQHAPSVSVSLAEEFGVQPGVDFDGVMVAALKRLGVNYVFDTGFSADLTIMEEGTELVHRIQNGGKLPMFTSCSPGWVKFIEQFYPEYLENVSTCKSPQQMLGAVIKSYWAQKMRLNPRKIFSVSIMPCTAKKFEASRPEMMKDGIPDVDAVITTRELARIIKMFHLDIRNLSPEKPDSPFGERSTAGKLFGATGGVMEAAVRFAYYALTGSDMDNPEIQALRGLAGTKTAKLQVGDLNLGIAVVNSLGQARKLVEEIKAGRSDLHFIEVMTCPGGCINGGGQPHTQNMESVRARMQLLYTIDKNENLRVSYKNSEIKMLYDEFFGEPNGHKSHELLHTHYHPREVVL